ncbi:MAG: SSU ribosomal protein S16p, partial [uncultured Acidimicrobiales bacterium]
GRQAPPHADGQEEAADLPGGRGRQPLPPQRAVHRDPRHLRAPPRAVRREDRQRQGGGLAPQGCPAHRPGRAAPAPDRCVGRVQGRRHLV